MAMPSPQLPKPPRSLWPRSRMFFANAPFCVMAVLPARDPNTSGARAEALLDRLGIDRRAGAPGDHQRRRAKKELVDAVGGAVLGELFEIEDLAVHDPDRRDRDPVPGLEDVRPGRVGSHLDPPGVAADRRDLLGVDPVQGLEGQSGRIAAGVAAPVVARQAVLHLARADDDEVGVSQARRDVVLAGDGVGARRQHLVHRVPAPPEDTALRAVLVEVEAEPEHPALLHQPGGVHDVLGRDVVEDAELVVRTPFAPVLELLGLFQNVVSGQLRHWSFPPCPLAAACGAHNLATSARRLGAQGKNYNFGCKRYTRGRVQEPYCSEDLAPQTLACLLPHETAAPDCRGAANKPDRRTRMTKWILGLASVTLFLASTAVAHPIWVRSADQTEVRLARVTDVDYSGRQIVIEDQERLMVPASANVAMAGVRPGELVDVRFTQVGGETTLLSLRLTLHDVQPP